METGYREPSGISLRGFHLGGCEGVSGEKVVTAGRGLAAES